MTAEPRASSVSSEYNEPMDTVKGTRQQHYSATPKNPLKNPELANCIDTDSYTEPVITVKPTPPDGPAVRSGQTGAAIRAIHTGSSSSGLAKCSGLLKQHKYMPINPNSRDPRTVYMDMPVSPPRGPVELPDDDDEPHYSMATPTSQEEVGMLPNQATDYEVPCELPPNQAADYEVPYSVATPTSKGTGKPPNQAADYEVPSMHLVATPTLQEKIRQPPNQAADYEVPCSKHSVTTSTSQVHPPKQAANCEPASTYSHLSRVHGRRTPPKDYILEGSSEDYSFLQLEESGFGGTHSQESSAQSTTMENPMYMYTNQKK